MKFEGGIKEILDFIEQTGAVSEIKLKLSGALIALVDSEAMKQAIANMATESAHDALRIAMQRALFAASGGFNRGTTIEGWYAEEFKKQMSVALAASNVKIIIRDMIYNELKDTKESLQKEMQRLHDTMKPFVAMELSKQIPALVTESYKERVAQRFDEQKIDALVEEVMRKAMARMFLGESKDGK